METNATKYSQDEKDWVLKSWTKILKPQYSYDELRKSFYQSPVNRNSCSVHWVFTMLANTFNVDFPLEERKAVWQQCLDNGASNEWGYWFAKAIKQVHSWCSEHKGLEFNYFSIQKEDFLKYAEQWFAIYWGYRMLEWASRDYIKDGVLWDDIEDYWNVKGWHAVCFTMIDWKFWFVNNYPDKTKFNEVKFHNLDELLKTNFFFNTGYICATTDEVVRQWYNFLSLSEKIKKLSERPEAIKNR